MARAFEYESFAESGTFHAGIARPDQGVSEDKKLAAYEDGYRAGWEDAAGSLTDDQSRVSSKLGDTLSDLQFTYAEAHAAVLKNLEPVIFGLISKVLPDMAREGIGAFILSHATASMAAQGQTQLEIHVAPANQEETARLANQQSAFSLSVFPDPSLEEGQAYFKFPTGETHIDLARIESELRASIESFFASDVEEVANVG